ncbi:MurR/RpiR family transcriptional regulator [Microbacterium koreense]|uniref:MurR/RpiR family transcriptional regulator n=1 Tax=Microbacterium koreense TaxID=323761 RepID=A0ABW2ZQU1_9MICO
MTERPQGIRSRIIAMEADLSPSERRVAEFFATQGPDTVLLSAAELGRMTRTSDATVIRTAKALGYTGLPELKLDLGGELMSSAHPARRLATRLALTKDTSETPLVERLAADAGERIGETERLFDEDALDAAAAAIEKAPAVMTFGVGLSRVIAEYQALRLGRVGKRVHFAKNMGFALADDLIQLREHDVIIVFNPGRDVREMTTIFERSSQVGATTIVVCASHAAPSASRADIVLIAPASAGGFTGETLTAGIIADVLVFALAQRAEQRATAVSEELTRLRRSLIGKRALS